MNHIIKQSDLLNMTYYQTPKWLFDMFINKKITQGGYKTYTLMYDRLKLSAYNNWIDEHGQVYIKYSYDELQKDLKCSRQAVSDNLKSLLELDLVDKIKGFNTSSKFYLKIFTSKENLTSSSLENQTNSNLENLTSSSLENLDANKNNFIKNKNNKNNFIKNNSDSVNYSHIQNTWNQQEYLPKIRSLSQKRKDKIKLRIQEHSEELFIEAINKLDNSNFCTGKNDRNWTADIDWLITNDTNIIKVLEGKYDNKQPIKQESAVDRMIREEEERRMKIVNG